MPAERSAPQRVERELLDDGLQVVRQAAPAGAHSVAITYLVPGGWAHDPDGGEGTAFALCRALLLGAGPWDRMQLDRRLDRLGAALTSRCDPESAELTVWGPEERAEELFDVLSTAASAPRLAPDDVDRVLEAQRERQLREVTQPGSRADSELLRALFPARHPYRLTGLGTERTLRRITPDRLRRFHRARYPARGARLVVTTRRPISEWVRRARRRWTEATAAADPAAAPPAPRSPPARPLRIALPGRTQVEIRVGGPSVPRSSPAYDGVYLANEVLGGRSPICRLFQTVRERAGLAYHASSEVHAMRLGGYWLAAVGTGPERVEPTLKLLFDEIDRIAERPIPSAELDRVRESAIGELPLALETTLGAHELAADIAYYDLPDDYLERWPDRLRGLSPARVQAAAVAGLSRATAATVIAGPAGPRASPGRR
ncbi:MAG TPA: pitrilysin family protein [Thermoplasmata archaeon]|nr:pitrilysin family protein [Thermoplasmata archaeon]